MNNKGFTLVEVAVTCAVIGILMAAMSGPTVKIIQTRAAVKTANEINSIAEAQKNYWIKQLEATGVGSWAPDIATLQAGGYIPAAWSGNSPFGQPYSITASDTCLTITTDVHPTDLQGALQAACPLVTTSGNNVSSSIPIPGQEPSLSTLLHKGQDNASRTADFSLATQKALAVGAPASLISNEDGSLKDPARQGDIYVQKLKDAGGSGWLSDSSTSGKVISVVGTTNISTSSTSWVDMPDMICKDTFGDENVFVTAKIPISFGEYSYVDISLVKDGVSVDVTRVGLYKDAGMQEVVIVCWAGPVTAGNHIFKIQWRRVQGSISQDGTVSQRRLILIRGLT